MKAKELYEKLDLDFELDKFTDDWKGIESIEYVSDNFKQRYMGVLLDNSQEIESVYTAVFPSDKVLNRILGSEKENILLFTLINDN